MTGYGYCSQFSSNLETRPGIYKITNNVNGKFYIGKSVNVNHRIKNHISASFNENDSSYNQIIHQAIRKYGPENFTYEVLEYCNEEELNNKEKEYILRYNAITDGYNVSEGGDGGPCANPKIELKRRNTVKEKYGAEHLMLVPEIQSKIKSTQREKWGGFLTESEIIREKARQAKLQTGFYKCVINLDTGLVFTVRDAREWCHIKDPDSIGKHINHPNKHKSCGKIPDDPRIEDKTLIGKPAHWDYISYEEYVVLNEQQDELM